MHDLRAGVILCLCCLWALYSCATPSSGTTSRSAHIAAPAELQAGASRKLPKTHLNTSIDFYPPQAKREGLVGRVLVGFQIDQRGKADSARVVGADAAPILQDAALELIKGSTFDVSAPGFDATDPTPFLVTVRFCLPTCGEIVSFPGSEDMTVSGYIVRGR